MNEIDKLKQRIKELEAEILKLRLQVNQLYRRTPTETHSRYFRHDDHIEYHDDERR